MDDRFEDRLERELLEAARRRTAARGGRRRLRGPHAGPAAGMAGAGRPRRRLLLGGAGAFAVLVLAVVLAIAALPLGKDDPGGALAAGRQCDEAIADGEMRVATTTVERPIYDNLGVLRRPATAEDAAACPLFDVGLALDPAKIRLIADDRLGNRAWLVPIASEPGPSRGPELCVVLTTDYGSAGHCEPGGNFLDGMFAPRAKVPEGTLYGGLFPDYINNVVLHFADGSTSKVLIRSNGALVLLPGNRPAPANTVVRATMRDGDRTILRQRVRLEPFGG